MLDVKRILSEYFKELEVDALSYKILKEILPEKPKNKDE